MTRSMQEKSKPHGPKSSKIEVTIEHPTLLKPPASSNLVTMVLLATELEELLIDDVRIPILGGHSSLTS